MASAGTVGKPSGNTCFADKLPDEINEMKIKDENSEKEVEAAVADGNRTETGHIIVITIGGRKGQPKQIISYMAERVVGQGLFGIVFQGKCLETGETVAIEKVLQDKRMAKYYSKANQPMPLIYVKLYAYQICRAWAYIHGGIGVCHRDIKPQNFLVNPHTHQVKLCYFGSTKLLVKGEPNIYHTFVHSITEHQSSYLGRLNTLLQLTYGLWDVSLLNCFLDRFFPMYKVFAIVSLLNRNDDMQYLPLLLTTQICSQSFQVKVE